MTDIDIIFCRQLLKEAHKAVRHQDPEVDLRNAWVWSDNQRRHWEFHGPDGYYWHGRAANAYDARYKGWMTWLEQVKIVR